MTSAKTAAVERVIHPAPRCIAFLVMKGVITADNKIHGFMQCLCVAALRTNGAPVHSLKPTFFSLS